MAYEDFTTFTEVDPGSNYTLTATKMNVNAIDSGANAYTYKDYIADHFGDFEHLLDIYTGSGTGLHTLGGCWAIGNSYGTVMDYVASNDAMVVYIYELPHLLYLRDFVVDNLDSFSYSDNTYYYLTIKRAGTTLTCKIYSDAARTNLLATLSIVCTNTKMRYCQGVFNYEWDTGTSLSYYIENLDLQEAPAPTTHRWIPNYYSGRGITRA